MANLGNYKVWQMAPPQQDDTDVYQGYGDQKFVTRIDSHAFEKLCSLTESTQSLFTLVKDAMYSEVPASLGFPDEGGTSNYYLGSPPPSKAEIEQLKIGVGSRLSLRNTRLSKSELEGSIRYEILVASASDRADEAFDLMLPDKAKVTIRYGDYEDCLEQMCLSLEKAIELATETQRDYLEKLILAYRSGDMETHK